MSKFCKDCFYSETKEIIDPVTNAFGNIVSNDNKELMRNVGLSHPAKVIKCHYAGKPQIVDGNTDWCYQWKPNREEVK
jgi:hypothetical protein